MNKPGPPKVIEILVWMVLPPACRESVVGDLHERYKSLPQYVRDAVWSVPLVIVSRIKRTTDAGLLLLEALALYLSFVASARFAEDNFLVQQNAYLRLAIPVVLALLSVVLVDAYARTERRLFYGPAAAMTAIWIQVAVTRAHAGWALPAHVVTFASGIGVLLVGSLRILFWPGDHRTTGA